MEFVRVEAVEWIVESKAMLALRRTQPCIGRIRKDARLLLVPDPAAQKAADRRLCYGPQAPLPSRFAPTTLFGIRSPSRAADSRMTCASRTAQVVQLVVVEPLGYRLRKASRPLYREPACLICAGWLSIKCAPKSGAGVWDSTISRWHLPPATPTADPEKAKVQLKGGCARAGRVAPETQVFNLLACSQRGGLIFPSRATKRGSARTGSYWGMPMKYTSEADRASNALSSQTKAWSF